MSIAKFPYFALALSVIFIIVLTLGQQQVDGVTLLPLLTLLLVSEFGFILNLITLYIMLKYSFQQASMTLKTGMLLAVTGLSLYFLMQGLQLWPSQESLG